LLNNFIAVFVITFYVLIGVRFEEKKLESEFGKSYKTYQSKAPKFIPHFGKKDK
jgi:protein-S-isoprenylcysteine O-methyltransferase Ste14